ncbi:Nuclear protein [Lasiodiplodia theobromae]|uniref:Protein DGCR14-like protein n=1 Tax=Lasiodiplodia theobromae TaxID=45133 RepID=A0A5N5D5F6_9PEZI|nr:Nuclear protein [Lasiodiplodia theobromae]KAB2573018.1 Protein DGCR14-like protein [Lasiodiplodia theobromae]KAF4544474.1 Nuclear protein [Lasiodiplodia theobromae]
MAPPSSSSNPPPPPPAPTTTTALTKRSRDTALMPPPPQQPLAKRIKRPPKILDEDTYTGTLDHIVARDFYPGLLEMRAQREYLAAVDSNDKAWQRDAGRNLERIMTPGPDGRRRFGRRGVSMTPVATTPRLVGRAGETPRGWGGETPQTPATVRGGGKEETEEERLAREEEERREREHEEMRGLSLNAFQAKYTSEDNESFNALLDRQNAKRAEKYAFLWQGNKIATGRQIAWREREAKLLKAEEEDKEGGGVGHIRNNDRALVRRDPERERDADTRKAMPDHRPAAPRNSLMFNPDSIEDTHETVAQAAQAASTAPPKAIIYNNTRLPAPAAATGTDPENSVPPSPSLSAVNDAIRGRPRPTDSEVGSAAAYSGSETPRVNGYAFVDEDDDPEPEPDHSLLQRLGITAGDDGGRPNPFSIRQASKREELHHRLVDKSAKAKREGSGGGIGRIAALKGEASSGKTPTPKFASSPVITRKAGGGAGSLTPAAQRLFARVGGTPKRDGLAGFAAFGGSNSGGTPLRRENRERVRWTPTPKVKRSMG